MLDIPTLKSIFPGLVSMKTNTSLAFIMSGLSLWLWHKEGKSKNSRKNRYNIARSDIEQAKGKIKNPLFLHLAFNFSLAEVFASIVLLIGLLTLSQYCFGWNLGIDQLLFEESITAVGTFAPNRMAPNTAVTFVLLGCAGVLLNRRDRKNYIIAQSLTVVAFLIALVGLLGYAYGIESFYGIGPYTRMALHTAGCFLLLCLGMLFASPNQGLMSVVIKDNAGGVLARRLFPGAIAIPPILGWFIVGGYRSNTYDTEVGMSLLAVFNVIIFAILTWWNANKLGAIDIQRQRAEKGLKQANQDLENRVEERTIELKQVNKELHQRITERIQIEEALQTSYNLLNAVLESTPDAIFVKDLQGKLVMVNSACANVLGYAVEELIGKKDADFLPPEIAIILTETDKRIMRTGEAETIEEIIPSMGTVTTNLVTKSPWRDLQGNTIGLIGIGRNISDRKALEREVARREQLLNSFVTVAPVGIAILDDQMRYLQVNEALAQINGVAVEQHLGRSISEILPDAAQVIEQSLRQVLTTGEAALNIEACGELPSQPGTVLHWITSQFPIPGTNGQPMAIGVTVLDITARKQAEEARREKEAQLKEKNQELQHTLQELQRTQSQLIQSEKMSSLGQLVAGIAHEINNPVNFIYGNLTHVREYSQDLLGLVELYQQHYPTGTAEIQSKMEAIDLDFLIKDFPNLLSSMRVGADRIREIVLSLRNFSRIDEAEMKEVNIHEGIDSTLMILHNRLKAKTDHPNIQVIKEYGNLPKVECYAGQLNQVFMNLVANAIDALDEYNHQRSLEEIKKNPSKIWICTEAIDKNRVVIKIIDNGKGMIEEVRQQLFNPFFTTKPIGKGTGLGLAISYQIVVEKHGGRLECISAPGGGAQFVIEIPIRQMI
ncbi:PAS domain-containing protein [Microcoleus sp. FACHB-831]|nr:PAS domain-containing protein [Microcoleus sp. FACHB-831]